jgi:adenylate cyclase class IV
MRADTIPGTGFPDYQLTDHTGKRRKLSELQGQDPRTLTPADLLAVLSSALGVRRTVSKTRVLLRTGQTRIHLDSVLGLGSSVEPDVVLGDGQQPEDRRQIARELMNALEIQEGRIPSVAA